MSAELALFVCVGGGARVGGWGGGRVPHSRCPFQCRDHRRRARRYRRASHRCECVEPSNIQATWGLYDAGSERCDIGWLLPCLFMP